ncbi:MAG: DUF441 domain-containing protein [Sulfobacillus acidophilus]|uniref:UPF0756 membrane protein C7B45_15285 n=1 Tax=Sulfobacillus acidophilus TaxID=53633 RepID=A0A2T2WDR5_9FIRM|nr:MAG: DUF441 domain-containing protein [Sulfobacillus acidophilus]
MFTTENVGLIILLILGLIARSNLVAAAATILLMLRFTRLTFLLPVLERRGVEVGLLFLTIAMLVPFALGKVNLREVAKSFITVPGILALVGGALATHLNGRGLHLLNDHSQLMISLIVGSIIGIVIWGGMPVGPLMAAGLTYLMLEVASWITHWWR